MGVDRRRFLVGVAGIVTTGMAGCTGSAGSGPTDSSNSVGSPDSRASGGGTDHDIGMASNAFLPREFEITVGSTVTWRNTGSRAHTVTAYEGRIPDGAAYFASGGFDDEVAARDGWQNGLKGAIYGGGTFEHTFDVPGTYDYFCVPHERNGMVGTIVVTE